MNLAMCFKSSKWAYHSLEKGLTRDHDGEFKIIVKEGVVTTFYTDD